MAKPSDLLKIAIAEIGYCEKKSNSQLDDKTANAGSNNWTKYARDLHKANYYQAPKNGYAWCDMFVDWCCYKLMGSKAKGEYLQCQTGLYGAGCEWSSDCYRRAGRFGKEPRVGAQIFFGKENSESHTGIVEKFDDTYVYTIEGNTSNKVKRKTYKRTDSRIVGYGYMRFDEEEKVITGTPSTGSAEDEKKMWNFLMSKINNEYGVAGLMGNINAESALRSNNLQQTYERSLGYTDTTYTEAVDNRTYNNFIKDKAGYGLAQWTYWTRKERLIKYCHGKNKSIGDFDTQLEFLYKELSENFNKSVLQKLKTAKTVREASDIVLKVYEAPSDQSEKVQEKRASYGEKYFKKYGTKTETKPVVPSITYKDFKVGDIVEFAGTKHYVSSSSNTAKMTVPGLAKVTSIYSKGKHQLHLRAINKHGNYVAGVHGWVDVSDVKKKQETKKTVEEIAKEVINGKWGNGETRKKKLTEAGYNYREVQDLVNKMLW